MTAPSADIGPSAEIDGIVDGVWPAAIEQSGLCARVCMRCADISLAGKDVRSLNRCIQLSLDCADRCFETAALSPDEFASEHLSKVLAACRRACELCAAECRRHAGRHEHCRLCADACEDCAAACRDAMASLAAV
jgi:hypothetical protein